MNKLKELIKQITFVSTQMEKSHAQFAIEKIIEALEEVDNSLDELES